MMNRRILLVLFACCNLVAFGQKAKVVSAYNYNKSYERDKECSELEKGINAIELASKDASTSNYAKTWYYGGNLYFNALLTADRECAAKFENSLEKCYTYYLTSIKLNIQDEGTENLDITNEQDLFKLFGYMNNKETKYEDISYLRDIVGRRFPILGDAFIEKGVQAFQNEDYTKAKEYSEKSIEVKGFLGLVDSVGMYNAALASERLGLIDDAIVYYTSLTKIGYGGADVYLYLANLYDGRKDTVKKMEVIRNGLTAYPDNDNLIKEQLSYLLTTGKTEEAMANFDKAIASDPENPTLYFNRGVVYDETGEVEKAGNDYAKALELKPDFFDAAYNLGAMYFNLGVKKNNEASSYDYKEQDKYEAAAAEAKEFFAKALPALEKAHEIDPSDTSTMASLSQVYTIVEEYEKAKAIKAKMGN